jgi:hypothetical protein
LFFIFFCKIMAKIHNLRWNQDFSKKQYFKIFIFWTHSNPNQLHKTIHDWYCFQTVCCFVSTIQCAYNKNDTLYPQWLYYMTRLPMYLQDTNTSQIETEFYF